MKSQDAFLLNVCRMTEQQIEGQLDTLYDVGDFTAEERRIQGLVIDAVKAIAEVRFPGYQARRDAEWLARARITPPSQTFTAT